MKKVVIKNSHGKVVEVKVGYSFTTMFFGFIPDLLRGVWKNAILYIVFTTIFNFILVTAGSRDVLVLTSWLWSILWGIKRNKYLLEHYLDKGYSIVALENCSRQDLNASLGYELEMGDWK